MRKERVQGKKKIKIKIFKSSQKCYTVNVKIAKRNSRTAEGKNKTGTECEKKRKKTASFSSFPTANFSPPYGVDITKKLHLSSFLLCRSLLWLSSVSFRAFFSYDFTVPLPPHLHNIIISLPLFTMTVLLRVSILHLFRGLSFPAPPLPCPPLH